MKQRIHIRLPFYLDSKKRQSELNKLLQWAIDHINKKGLYPAQLIRDYREKGQIEIAGHTWTLHFKEDPTDNKIRSRMNIAERHISFKGPFNNGRDSDTSQQIRQLLIKNLRTGHKEFINNLVSSINDKTLGFSYSKVSLKYVKSRWGSCSSKRNINLSLRLLLLPEEVRDYVIVHELAHLQEMNHSKAFWALVGQHVPHYKKHEQWLNKNGHFYDF